MASKADFTFPELEQWLDQHRVTEIECLVPDLTGVARGKILPRATPVRSGTRHSTSVTRRSLSQCSRSLKELSEVAAFMFWFSGSLGNQATLGRPSRSRRPCSEVMSL